MKRGFGSDNHSGFSPEVLEALARANDRHALAYGDDEVTARVEVNLRAMKLWAIQYGPYVKVLTPDKLTEEVKQGLEAALKQYN